MKTVFRITLVLVWLFSFGHHVFAVYPPESQSGGTYFYAKGTKSAEDYRAQGRTGRPTTDYYYGKGITTGPLTIKPMIGYAGQFDSNVFFEEDNTNKDYVSQLNWGIDGDLPFDYHGQHRLIAGVQSGSEWFAKESKQNHTDWTFQGGGQFHFAPFSLEVYEEFKNSSDRSGNEFVERVERNENFVTGLINVPLSQVFIETEVSDFNVTFDESKFEGLDRNEFAVFPRFGVNVGTRTQALAEYGYTNINYDNNALSGDANQVSVGLRGFAGTGDLISYQIWGGYEFINYDGSARENFNGAIGRGQLIYRLSERTKVIVDASRKPVESVTSTGLYYVRHEVSAKVRQQILEQFFATVRALGSWNQYVTTRDDFYWDPGVGLEYILPGNMVSIFSEYRYSGRESDQSNLDYMRHLATLGVKVEV